MILHWLLWAGCFVSFYALCHPPDHTQFAGWRSAVALLASFLLMESHNYVVYLPIAIACAILLLAERHLLALVGAVLLILPCLTPKASVLLTLEHRYDGTVTYLGDEMYANHKTNIVFKCSDQLVDNYQAILYKDACMGFAVAETPSHLNVLECSVEDVAVSYVARNARDYYLTVRPKVYIVATLDKDIKEVPKCPSNFRVAIRGESTD